METPFFPALRPALNPMRRSVKRLQACSLPQLQVLLSAFLPPHLLSQADEGANSRVRCLPLRRTFFAFLWQVLNPDAACREAVAQLQAEAHLQRWRPVKSNTSAYCLARQRLPNELLERLQRHTARLAETRVQAGQLWMGRTVKIVDGTTFSMPDTPANQRSYPQSSQQRPGCGFPLVRAVTVLSLASGAVLDCATGSLHAHEKHLFNALRHEFKPGEVIVADRGFCSYVQIALMQAAGVDVVYRLQQGRPGSGKRSKLQPLANLGRNDWLTEWKKSPEKPAYLNQNDWERIPALMQVRVVGVRVRARNARTKRLTLVTTLLDCKRYPAEQIAALFADRWRIESSFRELKTFMRMEVLRCCSPEMITKEIWMHLIAFNLIRLLMQEAATQNHVPLERLSHKGSVDVFRQYATMLGAKRSHRDTEKLFIELLRAISAEIVPFRPDRREPRAVKRRPKPYALLNQPRHLYRDIPHRSRYRKNMNVN